MNGADAEDRALALLESRGLELIVRNWRCRAGELDLVLRDGGTVVIAEVRHRARSDFGSATESVDARKQHKLTQAARLFLAARPELADAPVRFDIVALDGAQKIEWVQGAFEAADA